MSDTSSIEETIFLGARSLTHPQERAAYLDQKCGGDAALRERVERMLTAEQKADQFLSGDPMQLDTMAIPPVLPDETVGTLIGPYKVLQQIGEGGCGLVYMAEQEEPIRRRVALKVIKPGMDTRQVIARFEAERQALAMMDHPNIARVLDAGTTGKGRPYFVMELVRGIRITEYCDQNNVPTCERLDLFTKVVQAVQHAHQKGIIHRDLKPSNVLVTLHDGVPVPKVIDFGIAKALEQKLTDKTLFTQFEQFMGTPAYTSPEQAEMSGLDIDTRSDIYSLGVLLYELLVGQTPFDARALVHSGLDEMRRMIREEEPARPSTRLGAMGAGEVSTTAQRRRVSAPELIHLLKGDLDWIVMKCLEKDRTRRYATANGLADDIERYLGNEPIAARPPSRLDRWSKLIRRNKLAFAAGAAVLLALMGGIGVSTWQAVRAHRAELAAKEEKESAEAVLKFFRDKVLAAGRPEGQEGGLGRDVTLRQALDTAEAEIAKSFTNQPLVEASIRKTLGESYHYLGEPAKAGQQLKQALHLRWQTLGADHPKTLSVMSALTDAGHGEANLPVLEEALRLQIAKFGRENSETSAIMHDLALAYVNSGQVDKAVPLYEESLRMKQRQSGPRDPGTLNAMHSLARAYVIQQRLDQGLALFRETLTLQKSALKPDDSLIRMTLMNLASTLARNGKEEEAVLIYEELHRVTEAKYGAEHPDTLISLDELANSYAHSGKRDRAISLWESLIEIQKAKIGPEHPDTLTSMLRLANAYWFVGRRFESVRLNEYVVKVRRAKFGPDDSATQESMFDLILGYRGLGHLDEAEALCREVLKHGQKQQNNGRKAKLELADLILERSRTNPVAAAHMPVEVDQLLHDYLAESRARYTTNVSKLEGSLGDVAELCFRQGQFSKARPLYIEILQSRRHHLDPEHRAVDRVASVGRLLAEWAWSDRSNAVADVRPASFFPQASPVPRPLIEQGLVALEATTPRERAREAERLLRECLAVHLNGTNATHWRVDDVQSRLGAALVSVAVTDAALDATSREAKLAEAEALLLAGHQRLRESKSADKKHKRDALERLVRLYEAWGKPDQRAKWRQQFEETKTQSAGPAEQGGR